MPNGDEMRLIFIVCALAATIFISGCDQAKKYAGVTDIDNRVTVLEIQLVQLQNKLRDNGQWVLWQRFQQQSNGTAFVGYAPPQAVSAFATKSDCAEAASKNIAPGGNKVSDEPIEVVYSYGIQYFYCLPNGVRAGIQK